MSVGLTEEAEYGELMTKDQDLDVAVAILGGAACEPDRPAQH